MASGREVSSCSGRWMRSQKRETGLKQSFTEISGVRDDSNCCNTGATFRRAKVSPGSNNTGRRFMVAMAAPVIILVAPGPIELVQTRVLIRKLVLANAAAA